MTPSIELHLTVGEHDIMQDLANGLTLKDIAKKRRVQYQTVKDMAHHAYVKIRDAQGEDTAMDKTIAVIWLLKHEIISLDE